MEETPIRPATRPESELSSGRPEDRPKAERRSAVSIEVFEHESQAAWPCGPWT